MSKNLNSPPKMRTSGGYACVYLNGKRIRLGKKDSEEARKNYLQFLSEWANLQAAAGVSRTGRATVDELALAFLCYKKGKCGESDYGNYRTALEAVIQIYSGTLVSDFGCNKLDTVRNQFVERGYSRGHCNKLTGLIKTAFSWGVNKEIVPASVYQTLRCLKPLMKGQTDAHEGDEVEAVPDEVVLQTLPYLPPIIADMVKVQRLAAMRPNEVCRMKVGEITKMADVWIYNPPIHKNTWRGHEKHVPLGKEEQAILAPRMAEKKPTDPVFSPLEAILEHQKQRAESRKTKVQPSQLKRKKRNAANPRYKAGTHYKPKSYAQAIARAIEAANRTLPDDEKIPHWTPYQLRHTGITEIALQHDLETAKAIAGQKSLKVTQGYFHGDVRLAIQSVKKRGDKTLFVEQPQGTPVSYPVGQPEVVLDPLCFTSIVMVGFPTPVLEQ